jgi:hypothetical protein
MQHNPFYWHVMGGSFVRSEDTTLSSQFLDETLHEFLSDCTLEQKEILVKTTFEIVQVSEAVRVRDIPKGLAMRIPKVKKTISSISKEDREVVGEVLRILAGSGSRTAKLLMEKKVLKS